MSLRAIVFALGGDLYQNGYRANVRAPGHGPGDRSVSLVLSGGRVVIHAFGAGDWREVRDHLRDRGLIDQAGRPTEGGMTSASPRPDVRIRLETARNLWASGVVSGPRGLVARHLQQRSVIWNAGILDLREHPAAPLAVYAEGARSRRAMMGRVSTRDGVTTAVELTYLDPGGGRALDLKLSRKTVGHIPAGSAVRLSRVATSMVVGEGIVTTLSAMTWFGRPGWALLSAGNLARWRAPECVEKVIIAADRGVAGEAAASSLRARLQASGRRAVVVLPWEPWGDWNEAMTALAVVRREEGRSRASVERG